MSLEAWGDEGDGMSEHEHDALTGAGWLDPDDAEKLKAELRRAMAVVTACIGEFQAWMMCPFTSCRRHSNAYVPHENCPLVAQGFINPDGGRKT